MLLQQEKLESRAEEFEFRRFIKLSEIFEFTCMDCLMDKDKIHTAAPASIEGGVITIGDRFIGRDRYLWMETTVTLPPSKLGHTVVGLFDFGLCDGGTGAGFESLLWVNGEEYQAVDTNHPDVVLEPFAGQSIKLTFLLWSGLGGRDTQRVFEHRISQADIGYRHVEANEYYYLFRSGSETLALLRQEEPVYHELAKIMEASLCVLDFDSYLDTVSQALEILEEGYEKIRRRSEVTVHCIGHTHIDVAWLWRLKHTREKAQRSFATVLRLMEEYPEYVFLQSQPQLYKYLKKDNPSMYARLKERVMQGRWETDGGMWLEADCNISSGEALTRQFLHGIRFFKQEFGQSCEYLWLPDVFGYSWALPQILRGVGINTFMTTKISWNQFNTMPNDLFTWRGIDGTEVMTYFVTTPSHDSDNPLERFSTYNGQLLPKTVVGAWQKFREKDICRDVLISYGYGDGGGGVNREMLEMRRAMAKTPGLPNVETARAGDFFQKVHEQAREAELPLWDGELYLEYHRGTYTSQAYNKKMNRKLELGLARAEWLCCMAMLHGAKYPGDTLSEAWETVLRNQFHDIIPGSSIHEVYEDSRIEYTKAEAQMHKAANTALNILTVKEEGFYTIVNAGSFKHRAIVSVPAMGEGGFETVEGKALKSQRTSGGYLVLVDAGPISLTGIRFVQGMADKKEDRISVGDFTAQTPYYLIEWDKSGALTRIYDRENAREALGDYGNRFEIYEDKPLAYDAWDIDIFYTQKLEYPVFEGAELKELGALRTVIRFKWSYKSSAICQDMILSEESRRIDFKTVVDWHENNRLLKTAFDTPIRTTKATYDIQYGHCERPTHRNTSWDAARFEVCAHKWADLSEDNYGVSILNDCKYGYSTLGRTLSLTLLKSPKSPDGTADMGRHEFTYAVLPHVGSVTRGNTIEEATALNLPPESVSGKPVAAPLFKPTEGVVVIDAVKKAEDGDGIILRVHECRGGTYRIQLETYAPIRSAERCNLLEEPIGAVDTSIEAMLHPFEIATWRVRF